MLLEELDEERDAIINPTTFYQKVEGFPKTAVSFFSKSIMKEIIETYNPEIIAELHNATMTFYVYKLVIDGVSLALYQSPVGAPACVGLFEEVAAHGVENILLVGCCGCLENSIEDYSIIIPTSAIRDEGTSYHYIKASDEIELNKNIVSIIEKIMQRNKISYRLGKTWTTDAMYRETREKTERRKSQGAITVEMECSAMAAVSKYRNVNFGQFFYAADNLDAEIYDPRSLTKSEVVPEKRKVIPLAFECGIEIDNEM